MRRCLSCPTLITRGTRCAQCARAAERSRDRARGPRRSSVARHQFARDVKRRDGYRCRRCGGAEHLEAHHVIPLSAGGTDSVTNGVTLCRACHLGAHRALAGKAVPA